MKNKILFFENWNQPKKRLDRKIFRATLHFWGSVYPHSESQKWWSSALRPSMVQCRIPLKGKYHEIFDFSFPTWISFPQAADYTTEDYSCKKSRDTVPLKQSNNRLQYALSLLIVEFIYFSDWCVHFFSDWCLHFLSDYVSRYFFSQKCVHFFSRLNWISFSGGCVHFFSNSVRGVGISSLMGCAFLLCLMCAFLLYSWFVLFYSY